MTVLRGSVITPEMMPVMLGKQNVASVNAQNTIL
jgi:hypothetical protein